MFDERRVGQITLLMQFVLHYLPDQILLNKNFLYNEMSPQILKQLVECQSIISHLDEMHWTLVHCICFSALRFIAKVLMFLTKRWSGCWSV